MSKSFSPFFIFLFSFFAISMSWSQTIFSQMEEPPFSISERRLIVPQEYSVFSVNHNQLKTNLWQAPLEQFSGAQGILVQLPSPDGTMKDYRVEYSPVYEEGFERNNPGIRTFKVHRADGSGFWGRIDLSDYGFHAVINSEQGKYYIDPYAFQDTQRSVVYYRKDYYREHQHSCELDEYSSRITPSQSPSLESPESSPQENIALPNDIEQQIEALPLQTDIVLAEGDVLRRFRTAIAATGEYTAFHGGTVAQGQAAIVTMINRVNEIYESELAIRLNLISNNNILVETDAANDPYDNNNAGVILGQIDSELEDQIGYNNFDIGHVVSTGSGGLASLGAVCIDNFKSRGTSGLANPVGDGFSVDFVCHEIGHQFNAPHTYNNSCSNNRNPGTAYEPASGSTIMAYAGVCAPNLQNNSDPHFHINSLDRINTYVNNSTCFSSVNIFNTSPVITIEDPTNLTIPINTPFELIATATDAQGDNISFSWEQYDIGTNATNSEAEVNNPSGSDPLFRFWPPTSSGTRIFPRMEDIVNNTTVFGELLPSYSRNLNFRVTARDDNSSGGASAFENYSLAVNATGGAFAVDFPNNGGTLAENESLTVTWSVGNTNLAPFNVPNVSIDLSLDGGLTYPTNLVASTPNDGTHTFTIPTNILPFNVDSITTCRIKVKAVNSVFFDISNNDFTIVKPVDPGYEFTPLDTPFVVCTDTTLTIEVVVDSILTFPNIIAFSDSISPDQTGLNTSLNVLNGFTGDTILATINIPPGTPQGTYTYFLFGISAIDVSTTISIEVGEDIPSVPTLISPADNAPTAPIAAIHTWSAAPGAVQYLFEASTDSLFATIDRTAVVSTNSYQVSPSYLDETTYFWRVQAINGCGNSEWSDTLQLSTLEEAQIFGCTDSLALNFDSTATVDDGSCIPSIEGCTNEDATNFDPNATLDDGSCIVEGCTNPDASNFNEDATDDDGSCILLGCTDTTAFNFDSLANTDDGSCEAIALGCIDSLAINFDITANTDDGSCFPTIYGCTDPSASNYNPTANIWDNSCVYVSGCTDSTFNNFDPTALFDDGSCSNDLLFFSSTMISDSVFQFEMIPAPGISLTSTDWIFGDGTTAIGNPVTKYFATDDTFLIQSNSLAPGINNYIFLDTLFVVDIRGCTDPMQYEFSFSATIDDGSCIDHVFGCTDPLALNFSSAATFNDGTCQYEEVGCTDSTAFNYNPNAVIDDGSCVPVIFGCTDTAAFNFNLQANTDDGTCVPVVLGCTNPLASNYSATANTDDGTCDADYFGCTDSLAINFDTLATANDGSCAFDPFGNSGYWDVIVTGENHSIVLASDLDFSLAGIAPQVGDVIGVFYGEGDSLACGGKITWVGANTSLIAYGNDGVDSGFNVDEAFQWKMWDASMQEMHDLSAEYDTTFINQGQYDNDGLSKVERFVLGGTQQISILEGWNLVSTNRIPASLSIEDILQNDIPNIELVKDETGNVFWPQFGINTIGDITVGKAYKIRANSDFQWTITGAEAIPSDYVLSLPQGWSYLGYLPREAAPIANVLSLITDDIFIVKDGLGNVYWPSFGVDDIGNMEPGKGYQIQMESAREFSFPNVGVTAKFAFKPSPVHFKGVLRNSENMQIGILPTTWETTPSVGDEIGVFNADGMLLGAAVFSGENQVISVFGTTPLEELSLVLWDASKEKQIALSTEEPLVYVQDDVQVVHRISNVNSDVLHGELEVMTQSDGLHIHATEHAIVKVEVYNTLGQIVISQTVKKGVLDLHIVETFPWQSGAFIVKTTLDNETIVEQKVFVE